MNKIIGFLAAAVIIVFLLVLSGAIYTVDMTEQIIVTQFGKRVGEPITTAGLKFKMPFVQKANRFEKRILEWDGRPNEMPTKDKTYILVDTFGRWSISDPTLFFTSLRDERSALSRLDDILGSETRNAVANNNLIEIVRTTKDRIPTPDETLIATDDPEENEGKPLLVPITRGRIELEKEIFDKASVKLKDIGIELRELRFKRINYNPDVRDTIYQRMISERQQIAERFRSEGAGEAARIDGSREREVKKIDSEAYKTVQELKGAADAKATQIYAEVYNQSAEAAEFYRFIKTLETYKEILAKDTTVILSTKSDLFRFLKDIRGGEPAAVE